MSRDKRRARQAALQALFEANQVAHDPAAALLERQASGVRLSDAAALFAQALIDGVLDNREQIDEMIERTAPAWPIGQIAVTDRIALELGIFEACFAQSTPPKVAINEAVELAKKFGGENSAAFVNGVLRTLTERIAEPSHT